ncbi:MAG TPA: threonine ammonia-lyase IlvA [Candidatus Saccharimonadales bacterium]|nr:threonine ammonia-lyase IlvA [Candidatus Saccharimonadales bacterium]
MSVTINTINEAAERLKTIGVVTPLQYSKRLSEKYKAKIYLKREDLQEVRSFKIRGAYNKMSSLSEKEKQQGVVCASAGNHAQGVAYSCALLKIKGVIFMPTITPSQKIAKVKKFGQNFIEVKLVGAAFDEAMTAAKKYCAEQKAVFVHAFDDELVISGQGTVAKEIYEDLKGNIDVVVSCIGGGGLISGIASYMKEKNENIQIIGVEPEGAASMYQSRKHDKVMPLEKIDNFVDGAAVGTVGQITFDICKKYVEEILYVPEGKVCTTMIELYQEEGIIAEPAGALAVSGLDAIAKDIIGKTVVCIISGGNNDITRYPEIMERSLVYLGLKHYFIISFAQKPGQLKKFVNDALGPNDDISRFEYIKKTNKASGPALVGIELQNKNDFEPLVTRMQEIGIDFTILKKDELLYDYLI